MSFPVAVSQKSVCFSVSLTSFFLLFTFPLTNIFG